MLIDTHVHLDYPDFAKDKADVIQRAAKAGVSEMITIGTRLETSRGAIQVAEQYPNIWAAVGIHPLEVNDTPVDVMEQLTELARHPRVVAIGEIGLDYFAIDPKSAEEIKMRQKTLFHEQLVLAARQKLNVVLHQREAWEDTIAILEKFTGRLRGVFHCFKGTPAQVKQITAMGHLVSFTGMVTFPEMPQIAETAKVIPMGQFMLETDSPFHTPPPDRDGRCEPQQTRRIAELIAVLRNVSLEKLAEETTRTARDFFRLPVVAGP